MGALGAIKIVADVATNMDKITNSVADGKRKVKTEMNNPQNEFDKILKNPKPMNLSEAQGKIADEMDKLFEKSAAERFEKEAKGRSDQYSQYGQKILRDSIAYPMMSSAAMIAAPLLIGKLLNADIRSGFKPTRSKTGIDRDGNKYVDIPEKEFNNSKYQMMANIKSKYNIPPDQRLVIKTAGFDDFKTLRDAKRLDKYTVVDSVRKEIAKTIRKPSKNFTNFAVNELVPNTIKGVAASIPAAAMIAYLDNKNKKADGPRKGAVRVILPNQVNPQDHKSKNNI